MPLNQILLFGTPGSGKSTLAKTVAATTDITYISMSQLIQDEVTSLSVLGSEIKYYQDNMLSYPPLLLHPIVEKVITEYRGVSFILDSYPKNWGEVKTLQEVVGTNNFNFSHLIELHLNHEQAQERIKERISESSNKEKPARFDDKPEIVVERIRRYESEIRPLINECQSFCKESFEIDSSLTRREVYLNFLAILETN
ncbi:MAG: nucleoside monophosphate kinase [Richelia sp. RM2_1_2]|nr:nucleoside monophosphate kinase [Richelia sp. RM1_1_1]NJO63369.1 nucleoside monophosphate kinase [Richelia sp. RM2_1_2]